MSFLGKVYTFVKHEKFDEWLRTHDVPDDKIAAFLSQKPTQKIDKNGDSYVITQFTPKGYKDTTFKSGVEFDDVIGDEDMPVKVSYTVDGNTITQEIKTSSSGIAIFKREFNGDDLVVSITSDKYCGVAKRYYKA